MRKKRRMLKLLSEAFEGHVKWDLALRFYTSKRFKVIFRKEGFLLYKIKGEWAKIEYIAVKREFRGKGIGTRLLKKLEKICKKRNTRVIFVDAHDKKAIEFYLKNGFKIRFKALLPDEPESYILAKGSGNLLKAFWEWAEIVYPKEELRIIDVFPMYFVKLDIQIE